MEKKSSSSTCLPKNYFHVIIMSLGQRFVGNLSSIRGSPKIAFIFYIFFLAHLAELLHCSCAPVCHLTDYGTCAKPSGAFPCIFTLKPADTEFSQNRTVRGNNGYNKSPSVGKRALSDGSLYRHRVCASESHA